MNVAGKRLSFTIPSQFSSNNNSNNNNTTSARKIGQIPKSKPKQNTKNENKVASTSIIGISHEERILLFDMCLRPDVISFETIRDLAFQGIPDNQGLRPIFWKLLLSYLPADRRKWNQVLTESRTRYQGFREEFIVDPRGGNSQQNLPEAAGLSEVEDISTNDHPLSNSPSSVWNQYFNDKVIIHEIDKDVQRTFPHLHFFNSDGQQSETIHYQALRRILFIYAKLNPGIKYVQGMNEIVGPIYYLFATDIPKIDIEIETKKNNQNKSSDLDSNSVSNSESDWQCIAEADAFFCFTNVMSEIRDNFCKTLDRSDFGVLGNIQKLNDTLKEKDFYLWQNLEQKKLNPQFYSFRWITLLLSQEFELPDVVRLWDSLFADPNRFQFSLYFCTAMLIFLRDSLFGGDYSENLKLLQSYPPVDFQKLMGLAIQIKSDGYEAPAVPENVADISQGAFK